MKALLKSLRPWIGFTRGERNGSLLLLLLSIILLVGKCWREYRLDPFLTTVQFSYPQPDTIKPGFIPIQSRIDLNQISDATLQRFGLLPSVAKRIIRYRESRGGFQRIEDLSKVYGLTDTSLFRLQQLLYVEPASDARASNSPNKGSQQQYTRQKKQHETRPVNINAADSTILEALPGIGPYTAMKLLRFRDALGGFYSLEQMRQTKGIREEALAVLLERCYVPVDSWKKLAVNRLSEQELAKHPYISFKQATVLKRYILANGPLSGPDDLTRVMVFTEAETKQLLPYLKWD